MRRRSVAETVLECFGLVMFVIVIVLFFVWVARVNAAPGSNYDGGGGGYTQLPACSAPWLGVTLYVQGHNWRCVSNPYHWVIV